MRTEELIQAISADGSRVRPVAAALPLALFVGFALCALIFLGTMGVRPGLADAIAKLPVLLKHLFPLALAAAAFGAVARLSRPEARLDGWVWALVLAGGLAVASFWSAALLTPVAAWREAIIGGTALDCFLSISFLGLVMLGGALWALRRGASARPALSGALAGLLGGAAGAALFALHCTEDDPMFWGVWYVAAIGVVTGAGALLGRRLLRW